MSDSPYVPDSDGQQPYPSWKRIDLVQEALPAKDQGKTGDAGATITFDDYVGKVMDGTS